MKNLKLKIKMRVLIGVLSFGLMVLGAMSLVSMHQINNASTQIAQEWLPSVIKSEDLNKLMMEYRLYEYRHIIAQNNAEMQEIEQDLKEKRSEILERIDTYNASAEGNVTDKELIAQSKESITEYLKCHDRMISLSRNNLTNEAMDIMRGDSSIIFANTKDALGAILEYNKAGAEQASLEGDNLYYALVALTSIVTLVLGGFAAIFSFLIFKSIQKPVNEMVIAAEEMARGNINVELSYESKDEMGELASCMRSLMETLRVIIKDIDYLMKEMAAGNFNVVTQVPDRYVGDFNDVVCSIRDIRLSLGNAFYQIGQSADQVASGSTQVSDGAQALSQGSTEQASSVEELTATINEIAERVKQNAQDAQLARDTTEGSKNLVLSENNKVQQIVEAMANISNTSSEIEKIIKTIDDIAFQTNILALNAAVEAARAGEAGKGFAVVADEVRNLASKCAEAAKHITGLIETSISAVNEGSVMVDETAQSLGGVVDQAQKSSDLISGISVALNDQSSAILQISQGMDQISAVVQTNSATAEESAAASEELSGQAEVLKDLLSKFKFSNEYADETTVEQ